MKRLLRLYISVRRKILRKKYFCLKSIFVLFVIRGAAAKITNYKVFMKIIQYYYLGTTATLGTMGYTNAAVSSGALATYVDTSAVTFTCNSGYSTTETDPLIATCTSSGGSLSWVLTPNVQGACTGKKLFATFL